MLDLNRVKTKFYMNKILFYSSTKLQKVRLFSTIPNLFHTLLLSFSHRTSIESYMIHLM
jgi:hypothetical protein